jgi:hypothetical protein
MLELFGWLILFWVLLLWIGGLNAKAEEREEDERNSTLGEWVSGPTGLRLNKKETFDQDL